MGALVQVASILFFLLVARLKPRVTGVPLVGPDTLINLFTGGFLFALRIAVMLLGAKALQIHLIDLSFLDSGISQFLFAFIASDFLRYWVHRMHHRIPLLWQFHRVHHSSKYLDSTSGLRMHVFDFIQLSLIPVLLFQLLFNVSHFSSGVWLALGVVVGIMDAFQHSNLAMDMHTPGLKWWDRLLNNPHFHSWHHTSDIATFGDGNYSQTLTLWDRLFGSCVSQELACMDMGLDVDQDLDISLLGLQLLKTAKVDESAPKPATPAK